MREAARGMRGNEGDDDVTTATLGHWPDAVDDLQPHEASYYCPHFGERRETKQSHAQLHMPIAAERPDRRSRPDVAT